MERVKLLVVLGVLTVVILGAWMACYLGTDLALRYLG